MAVILGKIEHYDPQTEEWTEYIERVQQFFRRRQCREEARDVPHPYWSKYLQAAKEFGLADEAPREDF